MRLANLAPALVALAMFAACTGEPPGYYQGYVEAEFVHVGSGVSGRLETLHVERGQTIAAGTALFDLESSQEEAALEQTDAALNAAEAQLADLGTGRRSDELAIVQAQLDQARAAASQSAAQLARDRAQLEAGGIARMQLEATEAQHEINTARVRELESQLAVADLAARPEQIRAQNAMVAAARAASEQSRWRYDQMHVVAAEAGVVVDTLFSEGEWVAQGSPVIRMLPPANLKARFFVPQQDLSLVPVGQSLTLSCDGCTATVEAIVSFVAAEPEYTPPIIYSNENRSKLVFMIEASPVDRAAAVPVLRPGQPVEVRVQ